MVDKKETFNPQTDEHLIETLKRAYMFACGDTDIGTNEIQDFLSDALCNKIGDDNFCEFLEENKKEIW